MILLPFLGVLIYLIANSDGHGRAGHEQAQAAQPQFDEYVRPSAGSGGAGGRDRQGHALLDSGAITQAEFDAIKAKALGR